MYIRGVDMFNVKYSLSAYKGSLIIKSMKTTFWNLVFIISRVIRTWFCYEEVDCEMLSVDIVDEVIGRSLTMLSLKIYIECRIRKNQFSAATWLSV